jgi:hypothetical protein
LILSHVTHHWNVSFDPRLPLTPSLHTHVQASRFVAAERLAQRQAAAQQQAARTAEAHARAAQVRFFAFFARRRERDSIFE